MTVPLTPRELRIIADHVERLTKARVVNTQLGVDTTPDELTVDFPNRFTGTVHWTPGRKGQTGAERTAIARHARHRDSYQLDVATITVTPTASARMAAAGATISVNLAQGLTMDPAVVEHMARAVKASRGQQNTA